MLEEYKDQNDDHALLLDKEKWAQRITEKTLK